MFYRKWEIKNSVVFDVGSATPLETFWIKQGMPFLLISNVLDMCRGMHVWSHASYAEAFVALTNLLEQTLLVSLPERAELVLTALKADIK